jgi:hypothetical protein
VRWKCRRAQDDEECTVFEQANAPFLSADGHPGSGYEVTRQNPDGDRGSVSGPQRFIKAVHVTHAAPAHRAEYDRIFQLPVVFQSDRNALLMTDDSWLTLKNPLPSRYVFGILSERAQALLARIQALDRQEPWHGASAPRGARLETSVIDRSTISKHSRVSSRDAPA